MRIGKRQLELLIGLGSPCMMLIVGDRVSESLTRRGLLRGKGKNDCLVITPAGLRVLADEMEAGRVTDALTRMEADIKKRSETVKRKRKGAG